MDNINVQDENGYNALMTACEDCWSLQKINKLVTHPDIDINFKNNQFNNDRIKHLIDFYKHYNYQETNGLWLVF